MITRDYLENCGHQVFEARHGGEALEKAEEVSPDLILMDVQMRVERGRKPPAANPRVSLCVGRGVPPLPRRGGGGGRGRGGGGGQQTNPAKRKKRNERTGCVFGVPVGFFFSPLAAGIPDRLWEAAGSTQNQADALGSSRGLATTWFCVFMLRGGGSSPPL
ncbi:MAG: hypothetical protein IPL17_00450 [Anaerolineales bacterium]|nr:hypothetical protein [Anaerolineales bacterium]